LQEVDLDAPENIVYLPKSRLLAAEMGLSPHPGGHLESYYAACKELDAIAEISDSILRPRAIEDLQDAMRIALANGDLFTNNPSACLPIVDHILTITPKSRRESASSGGREVTSSNCRRTWAISTRKSSSVLTLDTAAASAGVKCRLRRCAYEIGRLTRRAKHWQNGIIEKLPASSPRNSAGFVCCVPSMNDSLEVEVLYPA
jgi:hypothetical protein